MRGSRSSSRAARRRPGLADQAENKFASSLLHTLVQREVRRVIRSKGLDADAGDKLKKLQEQAAKQKVAVVEVRANLDRVLTNYEMGVDQVEADLLASTATLPGGGVSSLESTVASTSSVSRDDGATSQEAIQARIGEIDVLAELLELTQRESQTEKLQMAREEDQVGAYCMYSSTVQVSVVCLGLG